MPHGGSPTRSTNSDFFEQALDVKTWLMQLSGVLKAVRFPTSRTDHKDLPSSEAVANPPSGWLRQFWKGSARQWRNSSGVLVNHFWGREQTPIKTADYTTLATDDTVLIDLTSLAAFGTRTVTLPLANSVPKGKRVTIKRTDGTSNKTLAVVRQGTDTIEDGATSTESGDARAGITLESDGSSVWYLVSFFSFVDTWV